MIKLYPVLPVPAPRQVARDKFKPSPSVQRYRAYRDELRLLQVSIPTDFHHVVFLMPVPFRWTASQAADQLLAPHQRTPDRDNLEKALLDSALTDDSGVWNGQATKLWWTFGSIVVADYPMPVHLWHGNDRVHNQLLQAYVRATEHGQSATTLVIHA